METVVFVPESVSVSVFVFVFVSVPVLVFISVFVAVVTSVFTVVFVTVTKLSVFAVVFVSEELLTSSVDVEEVLDTSSVSIPTSETVVVVVVFISEVVDVVSVEIISKSSSQSMAMSGLYEFFIRYCFELNSTLTTYFLGIFLSTAVHVAKGSCETHLYPQLFSSLKITVSASSPSGSFES